ncbi:NmrA-like family protein [Paenibacillus konkukensis]|uniref:NmrA-like family protein n=1 Tax=Paenibacillus konkukensis TaxID=2020716 RepID=A0ABY4RW26_9BACL|nr:NAD(P)-binding oxidoreductase [Paenibacillus konkukensis]UQZ86448.1 NmrA-like family protein [Paenibacillus konkukensis]
MNLLILGATGPTGRYVVDRALQSGDTITVLARRPEALADLKDKIKVVVGDATSKNDLVKAMMGQDAVIATLGRGKSIRSNDLFTSAARAIVNAAKQAGVSRLVWLSSFGVGNTIQNATIVQKFMYRTLLRDLYVNKESSEKIIRGSKLNWTIVYPTALMNGPAKGMYQVKERIKMKGAPRIRRADVADFMHKAAYSDEWSYRHAVITD